MALPESDGKDSHRKKLEAIRELAEGGNYQEAMTQANELLSDDFNDFAALALLGYCLLKTERFGLAYNIFRRVSDMRPQKAEPWCNAGVCHQEMWNLDDAEKCFRRALQLETNDPAALNNLALVYINRCQPDEAIKWIRIAEKLSPKPSWEQLDNKALALLMKGEWQEGWAAYKSTAGCHKVRQLRSYSTPEEPMWNGEKGTVVVYGTQGIGDELSFASMIPEACEKADIIVDCDHRLEGLFKRSFPQAKVYGTRFKEANWTAKVDYSTPVDCLAAMFRNKSEDFPGVPYLKADPERRIQWRALFDTMRKPVIGIAWTGGRKNTGKRKRSLSLDDLEPILRSIDATWVSLEYVDHSDHIEAFTKRTGIKIHEWKRATQTQDYDDTAALVAELDCVVSVTTAVIHLAGALGKDCFCLVPSLPRWWYRMDGDSSPWYKSLRLYRQKKGESWERPIKEVAQVMKLRYGGVS
jgi:Flp pilus assembly protein TadD/ADP-heptose:LPS heptosyltransferase